MRIPKQMRTSLLALTAVFLFCIIIVCMAFAEETEFADLTEQNASAEAEIVFLLDTSESMKTQDRAMRAVDAIRQGAYSLPSNYPVGMISYGTEVWEVMPLSTDRQKLDMQLDQIQYGGYTNAGAGLSQAVALFSESNEKNDISLCCPTAKSICRIPKEHVSPEKIISRRLPMQKKRELIFSS